MLGAGLNAEDMGAIIVRVLKVLGGLGGGLGPGRKGGTIIWVSIDIALMNTGIIGEKGTLVRTILEVQNSG